MTADEIATRVTLDAILVGKAQAFGRPGVKSGMAKTPVSSAVMVTSTGIVGDEQGDLVNHGGLEKAVHHYPRDHYSCWATELEGPPAILGAVGAFGENLSTTALTENAVCIGDIWRAGAATLQVSQARQPCWKLNVRFGVKDMAKRVQHSARTGWYYRILEEGVISPGDGLELLNRGYPNWPLSRLQHTLYIDKLNRDALAEMADLPVLAEGWRTLARRRLEKNRVEDWSKRLEGEHAPNSPTSLVHHFTRAAGE
ncbi:MAG: MOSC domain-containing protein [Chitinophagales bacterium]|nr:MOSC domain-containing protein [Hyphomicrobiales bacterium]